MADPGVAPRVRVAYIAGASYSGSTLLGVVLGADPSVTFAGEVDKYVRRFDLSRRDAKGGVCACGEPLQECTFWTAIRRRQPPGPDLHPAPGISWRNLVFTTSLLWPWPPGEKQRAPSAYGALIAAIHQEAVLRDPHVCLVVDSSKSARSLDLLRQSANIDLSVVHIVRDGAAVAAAYKKRGQGTLHGMASWLLSNLMVALYVRKYRVPCLRVDYAALCDSQPAQLERLNRFLGTHIEHASLDDQVRRRDYHSLAGNRIRRQTRSFPGIVARPSPSELNRFERWAATLLAPFNRPFPDHRVDRSEPGQPGHDICQRPISPEDFHPRR